MILTALFILLWRFGKRACDGNKEQAARQTNRVEYPFRSFDGKFVFQKLKSSRKEFDINTDGSANVGLLPDFIEDPRKIGFSDDDIEPLFRGAEGYIQTWENYRNLLLIDLKVG